jgi:hypothetical protein
MEPVTVSSGRGRTQEQSVDMARRVYFSFHYADVANFRANVVRNHWLTKPDRDICGYYDASIWEAARRQGNVALKRLVNAGLEKTSTTCLLIGSQTYERPWIRYELLKSFKKGNQIVGVHINAIKAKDGSTKIRGPNPLKYVGVSFSSSGLTATLLELRAGQWHRYDEIDGSASYRVEGAQKYRGKSYSLADLFTTYDWISDNGFSNFANWVD